MRKYRWQSERCRKWHDWKPNQGNLTLHMYEKYSLRSKWKSRRTRVPRKDVSRWRPVANWGGRVSGSGWGWVWSKIQVSRDVRLTIGIMTHLISLWTPSTFHSRSVQYNFPAKQVMNNSSWEWGVLFRSHNRLRNEMGLDWMRLWRDKCVDEHSTT